MSSATGAFATAFPPCCCSCSRVCLFGSDGLGLEFHSHEEAQLFYQQSCDKHSDAYADLQNKILEYRQSIGE